MAAGKTRRKQPTGVNPECLSSAFAFSPLATATLEGCEPMRYTPGFDKLLFPVGTHRVMYDRLQLVLHHPLGCPQRGSGLDKGKTFHPWQLALERMETCGLALMPEQRSQVEAVGREVALADR